MENNHVRTIYNYTLENSSKEDIEKIKCYKLKSIVDYAKNLSDEEIDKIDAYIQSNVPKQLKDYKNIKYNNKVIGCLLVSNDNNRILLDEIYLEKEYRNKGIGTSIIKNIMDSSNKNLVLWVYKNNTKATNLYLKLGFKVIDETDTRYNMEYKR